ncbi:hypothetical protein TPHA_0C01500 [Tetrapisispora phaffii CBS 4417]|uniref:Mediator of RNA polymerase II transcription subunit 22 n=1 Tax=Tetrapisispora phaffii (strain ATCC 24235 / CBS 4417 / NBRC 1672 / NRRL Y-8282 / UCD 70-5) TaxID=1071381 RepID=G8BRD0_TETPH|nr:hypothetical protein TPHA_0C01500 [Tetrapisispora phaffii CBS 4417]CCE62306.1 hypothetical protein TPHA_0C01500 [Tetrapisispora phaffii CBS 4417]
MSNQVLYERLGQSTELISTKLIELIKYSSVDETLEENEDKFQENSKITSATTSILMVNNQTTQLIKGIQDLLVLSRTIREKWLLNQIPEETTEQEGIDKQELDNLKELLKKTMNEIVGQE